MPTAPPLSPSLAFRLCVILDSVIRMNKYHFAMVNDTLSTKAYHAALQKVIKADSVVLQLGVGSGVLAMMAAKLGAKKVICLEVAPPPPLSLTFVLGSSPCPSAHHTVQGTCD